MSMSSKINGSNKVYLNNFALCEQNVCSDLKRVDYIYLYKKIINK